MRNKCLDLKVHNMRHAFCKDQVLIFAAIQGPSLREAAFEHHCTPWGNGAGAEKEGSPFRSHESCGFSLDARVDHQSSDAQ